MSNRKPLSKPQPVNLNNTAPSEAELEGLFVERSSSGDGDPLDQLFGLKETAPPQKTISISGEEVAALISMVNHEDDRKGTMAISRRKLNEVEQIKLLLKTRLGKKPRAVPTWKIVELAIDHAIEEMKREGGKSSFFRKISVL